MNIYVIVDDEDVLYSTLFFKSRDEARDYLAKERPDVFRFKIEELKPYQGESK